MFVVLAEVSSANFILAASPLEVVINEIAWMGMRVDGVDPKNWWRYEWLELYNNTDQPISLDGWKIELYRTRLDWGLELKGNIPVQGYFLIAASDKIFSNYDLNYSNLGGKFTNSGQKVILKEATGRIMDEIDCSSGWFAGNNDTKQTMERKNPELLSSDPNNWQTSQNPGGTPKAKNSIIVQTESQPKKELAAVGEQIPKETSFPSLIIALATAIFSGTIILILKKQLKKL